MDTATLTYQVASSGRKIPADALAIMAEIVAVKYGLK